MRPIVVAALAADHSFSTPSQRKMAVESIEASKLTYLFFVLGLQANRGCGAGDKRGFVWVHDPVMEECRKMPEVTSIFGLVGSPGAGNQLIRHPMSFLETYFSLFVSIFYQNMEKFTNYTLYNIVEFFWWLEKMRP